jgi:hypothetical protein
MTDCDDDKMMNGAKMNGDKNTRIWFHLVLPAHRQL